VADNRRVVAVVVTWNRCEALRRCLAAIDEQSRPPDSVLVVDNASTDGTAAMVRALETRVPVTLLEMDHNTGGAGGFHAGLREAVDDGADLVWLMDDDGYPPPDLLARLLPHAERLGFLGPAVVVDGDPERLCFPVRRPGTSRVLYRMSDLKAAAGDGVLPDVVIPFNGVLVSRALVQRIGLPRQEFFIWGDDVEYLWRARRAGAAVGTVVDAHFLHPATDDLGTPMMFGRSTYNHSPSDLKHYCLVRNNVTNLREYVGLHGVAVFLAKTVWFYLFTKPRPDRLRLSAQALVAALRRDFTGHTRFLT